MQHIVMMIRLVVIFILVNCARSIMSENNHFVGSVYIDVIAKVYLKFEENLWNSIENSNQSDIMLNIHTKHLDFYRNSLAMERRRTENYKSNFEKIFGWEVVALNSEIDFVKTFELRDSIEDVSMDDTIQMAKTYIGYTTVIDKMYNVTVDKNVFEQIKQMIITQNCSTSKPMESVNLVLFNYYTDISTSLLKAYSLLQLSYMILTLYGTKNYTIPSRDVRKQYKNYIQSIQKLALDTINNTDRNYWLCDGIYPQHFAQVTKFLQGYIENEVNLNEEGSCRDTCSDYTLTRNYDCYNGTLCHLTGSKGRCNGTVHSCNFIESALSVCSEEGTNRRYSNIKYLSGRQFGSNECHGTVHNITSWNRWFVHCSYCFCYCDSVNDDSDKYFSLQPVLSDKRKNKVVTGVALQKLNQTIYWKIAQAKLLPYGGIDNEEDNWTEIKEFNLTDMNIHNGYDYHTLSWENRSINVGSVIAPNGAVVTGVRFQLLHNGHLNLQIQATKFDLVSGKLYDSFEWISNLNNHRDYINLYDVDVPEKSRGYSMPNWQQNAFVEFQPTDMVKDISQTTVPYIDTQLVEPFNPVPLAGVGIYWKGESGYGGYIAPNLITYDYSRHIG